MTNADQIIIFLLLIINIPIILFTYRQTLKLKKHKRINMVLQLCEQFYHDNEMLATYYNLEYNRFIFKPESFKNSEDEKKINKLLSFFSNIAKLYNNGIIDDNAFDFIKYEFRIIYSSEAIQAYFKTLDACKSSSLKYDVFRQVGKKITAHT